jgi:hypothetical protein
VTIVALSEQQIRRYHHPEEDPRLFWVHPIWTQLVAERGLPSPAFANVVDAVRR